MKETISVETCSECHPFYTGRQKFAEAGGRVDRFNKKYGIKQERKMLEIHKAGRYSFSPAFYRTMRNKVREFPIKSMHIDIPLFGFDGGYCLYYNRKIQSYEIRKGYPISN